MAYIPDQTQNTGLYVPTTNVWDVSEIYQIDINSDQFKELLVRLYQNVNDISLALNNKESAFYYLEEFVTGQQYFNPASNDPLLYRNGFRRTVNTPNVGAGVNTFAHGITIGSTYSFVHIYGALNNTTTGNYYPISFASAGGANNIELRADNTNVVITNNSGLTFLTGSVVLEYVKN